MNVQETVAYLQEITPFQELDDALLRDISDSLSAEFYPEGSSVIDRNKPSHEVLRIVKKGAIKVFLKSDQAGEVLVEYLNEGDSFGYPFLFLGEKSPIKMVALEDTTCLLLERNTILALFKAHPVVAEQFFLAFQKKYIDGPYKQLKKSKLLYGGGDRLLFSTPVGQLVRRELITAPQEISIREASSLMTKHRSDSLVLLDGAGLPAGIITDRDLRDRVVSKNRDVNLPASTIQSVSLIKAEAGEHCIEALYKMLLYNIHHLLVITNGRLKGVISSHDLMMLQGTSPTSLVREIEGHQDLQRLIPMATKIEEMNRIFLQEGVRAGIILRIITEIKERLVRKMVELLERKAGPAPLPFCLVALGRYGRKEQAFSATYTVREIGLIYGDPGSNEEERRAGEYFTRFCSQIRENLLKISDLSGIKDARTDQPYTCQSLTAWKTSVQERMTRSKGEDLRRLSEFFDSRPIYGEFGMAEGLHHAFKALIEGRKSFLTSLALMMLKNSPPIRFFKNFVVEKSGVYRDQFDLVGKGLTPLVDMIRFFSLEKGVSGTSTLERIEGLKSRHSLVKAWAEELEYGFEFIMGLILNHALALKESGESFHPYINPDHLNTLEKKTLREAFGLIAKLQSLLLEKYQPLKL